MQLKTNHKKGITDDELITQLQMLAKKLGKTPTAWEFKENPETATCTTAIRHFGSWNNFLEVAGLETNHKKGITDDELITQLQMLAKELGKTPTIIEFDIDPRTANSGTVKKHFGSWNNLLEIAGLETRRKKEGA